MLNRFSWFLVSLLLGLALLAGGCSSATRPDPDLKNFVMNFSEFTPHLGDTFYLKVVDTTGANPVVVGRATPAVLTSAAFNVTLPSIIQEGHTYQIDFWADVDGNGLLDHSPAGTPAGVDHSWRKLGIGVANGLQVSFVHDTNWTDITPW